MGESCMIRFGERNNILTSLLLGTIHRNTGFDQLQRIHSLDNKVEESGIFDEKLTVFGLDNLIKFFLVFSGNDVPSFCSTLMHVIDTKHVQILNMPAESGKKHSSIHPRHRNSANALRFCSDYLKQ
jgi:hypothetical protein